MRKLSITLTATFLATLCYSQVTQQVDSLADLSLEQLLDIKVFSASKFEQTIRESPSAISVVTRDQIKGYGWLSSNDILSRQPGFALSQDYERQTISSRGVFESWNSNHLLMLIDGVSVNHALGGSAFTSEATPLVFAKSVEIIRGPGSALYGSNATNGVIGIRTISASDLDKNVEVRYRRASWNTNVWDLVLGSTGKDISLVSAFNMYSTDGFSYNSLDASNSKYFSINNSKNSTYLFNKIEGQGRLKGWALQHHEQSSHFSTGHGWLSYVPDVPENMSESRRILSLSFKTPDQNKAFQNEFVAKYQRHHQDFFQRFYPAGSDVYPLGLTEVLKTNYTDYFARAQVSYSKSEKSNFLAGVEYTLFNYTGDETHLSNAYLDGDYSPTIDNQLVNVGSYMPWYNGAYNSSGIYAQSNTKLLPSLQATVGLRYDLAWFKFNDLTQTGVIGNKALDKLNPRLSLVFTPTERFTIKAMAGSAFRSPSPFELFVGNSYNGATNPKDLKPEIVRTYELASDYSIGKSLTWRMNIYSTETSNLIAYGGANNVLINLFSTTTAGIENEILYKKGVFDGFLNYSLAERVGESAAYPSISIHSNKLTWYPKHIANLGFRYSPGKWMSSLQIHYQGMVERRDSDRSPEFDALRGSSVAAWKTVDLKLGYKVSSSMNVGFQVNNLLDEKAYLFKTYLNPFDYQIPGRRVMIDVLFKF